MDGCCQRAMQIHFQRVINKRRQKRLNELAEKYQTEGLFPDGSICRFRINLKLYQIRSVFWLRTVPFICQRKH